MAMGFYQLAADRAMRELGITMVGGMLTTLEKDERARQMTGEGGTLVSAHCDVHVPSCPLHAQRRAVAPS